MKALLLLEDSLITIIKSQIYKAKMLSFFPEIVLRIIYVINFFPNTTSLNILSLSENKNGGRIDQN